MRFASAGALLSALLAAAAYAQQYRWVDEKGRVHYTDTPPPASAQSVQKKNLEGNAVGAQQNFELARAMKSAPVKLYTEPDCKDLCQSARDALNRRGIPFEEVSITDAAKLDELRRVSGAQRVPVLVVGSYVEKTPTAQAYNDALDWAGYPALGVLRPRHQAAPPPPPPAAQPQAQPAPAPEASAPAENR
jgi:glutaredoxin